MVDFAKMTEKLRTWKQARAKIGCECEARDAVLCRQWHQDIPCEDERPCKCKCHEAI